MTRAAVALLLLAACSHASNSDGVVDLDGHAAALPAGERATVLVFLASNCPISTRYLPELGRLRAQFAERGVAFAAVYPNADEPVAEIRAHAHDLGAGWIALRDPLHALAHRAAATITPEAAVLGAGGELLYHGRIDDRVVDFGRNRPEPEHRELADALAAVLAGTAPVAAAGSAIGCAITEPAPVQAPE